MPYKMIRNAMNLRDLYKQGIRRYKKGVYQIA